MSIGQKTNNIIFTETKSNASKKAVNEKDQQKEFIKKS